MGNTTNFPEPNSTVAETGFPGKAVPCFSRRHSVPLPTRELSLILLGLLRKSTSPLWQSLNKPRTTFELVEDRRPSGREQHKHTRLTGQSSRSVSRSPTRRQRSRPLTLRRRPEEEVQSDNSTRTCAHPRPGNCGYEMTHTIESLQQVQRRSKIAIRKGFHSWGPPSYQKAQTVRRERTMQAARRPFDQTCRHTMFSRFHSDTACVKHTFCKCIFIMYIHTVP